MVTAAVANPQGECRRMTGTRRSRPTVIVDLVLMLAVLALAELIVGKPSTNPDQIWQTCTDKGAIMFLKFWVRSVPRGGGGKTGARTRRAQSAYFLSPIPDGIRQLSDGRFSPNLTRRVNTCPLEMYRKVFSKICQYSDNIVNN